MSKEQPLPQGWVWTTLGEITQINPGIDILSMPDTTSVSFIPMAAVEAGSGYIDTSTVKMIQDVKKGYTAFQENDILFAKITPCMENGKIAIAQSLVSGVGFGSTEFHVLRSENGIKNELVYYYVSHTKFRSDARRAMTGSAGQLRVPATFLVKAPFPLPPYAEQERIVAAIRQHFKRLDDVVAALRRAQEQLKKARKATLKYAVEGRLTEAWRAQHPAEETGAQLLKRILDERRARWEAEQLAKMAERGITPRDDSWKKNYKEPVPPKTDELPALPEGWCWATVEQISYFMRYGTSAKTSDDSSGIPVLRMGNIQEGQLDFSSLKYLPVDHNEFPDLLLQTGDLLFNRTNSAELVGKSAVYRGDFEQCSYASYLICLRTLSECLVDYLCFFLNSFYGKLWIASVRSQQAGQANVSGSKLLSLVIPLPPLAEQQQIVMAVERRLAAIARAEERVASALKHAEQLRQSILKQAFAGKLVAQNPQDEPASVLLERIRVERKQRELEEQQRRKELRMNAPKRTKQSRTGRTYTLPAEILIEAQRPLAPDVVFTRTGLDADVIEDVEEFIDEVQLEEEQRELRILRPDDTQVFLEAVEP